jgi:hypothetical protein
MLYFIPLPGNILMREKTNCFISTSIILLVICGIVCGCTLANNQSPGSIIGRWQIISNQGVDIPNSFFWLMMDYIEFRENGEVWALMGWPPGEDQEIRLNGLTEYAIISENQVEITGSCRHQDPCTGIYITTFKGEGLRIIDTEKVLLLKWVGPSSAGRPPDVSGPFPTSTPETIE